MSSKVEQAQRPSAQDALRRAMILTHIHVKAAATPPEEIIAQLSEKWTEEDRAKFIAGMQTLNDTQHSRMRAAGLWEHLDASELAFMQTRALDMSMRQRIDASWVIESIACLCWALGYLKQLPPYDQQAGKEVIAFPKGERAASLLERAQLRAPDEIDRQRDWAELWHWRCRTHMLLGSGEIPAALPNGTPMMEVIRLTAVNAAEDGVFPAPLVDDFPVFGKPFRAVDEEQIFSLTSIARERHKAFNWLCGFAPGNRWAETPTDT